MSGHLGDLSEGQQNALDELRKRLHSIEDESLREYGVRTTDDRILLRFLRARNFIVNNAEAMMLETLRWRTSFQDKGVDALSYKDCMNELSPGKSFFHGVDKEGRPVCIIKSRLHDPSKSERLEAERFAVCMIEYGRRLLKLPVETVTLVFDMSNSTMKNIDIANLRFMIKTLQSHYPECLGKILVFNSSWIFWGIWKLVKPMLDPVTAAKLAFVDKNNIKDFIQPDVCLKEFGGNDCYEYNFTDYSKQMGEVMSCPYVQ